MAGKGPAPKPAHMRQHRLKKAGATTLDTNAARQVPVLPNPDGREWHKLTRAWWKHVWESPMAGEYLETDIDGLGRLAILVDEYYWEPDKNLLAEIRLQEARFGLSPVDRSRLQWDFKKGKEAARRVVNNDAYLRPDPRSILETMN